MPILTNETEKSRCVKDLGELLTNGADVRYDIHRTEDGRLAARGARLLSFQYTSRKRRIFEFGIMDAWEVVGTFETGAGPFTWKFSAEELHLGPIRKINPVEGGEVARWPERNSNPVT